MSLMGTILIGIGLSMDAFAVSICKGLSIQRIDWKKNIIVGVYFGFFQMAMPMIGYILGIGFNELLERIDHWIAFALLSLIGINMIKESFSQEQTLEDKVNFQSMIILSIATSIDALAIGITYAFLDVKNVWFNFILIGIITFLFCIFGVRIGNRFGDKYGQKAEIIGGAILMLMGIKILFEHLLK